MADTSPGRPADASPINGQVPPAWRRFGQPGQNPPNTNGNPESISVRNRLRKLYATFPDELDKLASELDAKARTGDRDGVATLAELINQLEGKPKETIAHEVPAAPIIQVIKSGDTPPKPPESP